VTERVRRERVRGLLARPPRRFVPHERGQLETPAPAHHERRADERRDALCCALAQHRGGRIELEGAAEDREREQIRARGTERHERGLEQPRDEARRHREREARFVERGLPELRGAHRHELDRERHPREPPRHRLHARRGNSMFWIAPRDLPREELARGTRVQRRHVDNELPGDIQAAPRRDDDTHLGHLEELPHELARLLDRRVGAVQHEQGRGRAEARGDRDPRVDRLVDGANPERPRDTEQHLVTRRSRDPRHVRHRALFPHLPRQRPRQRRLPDPWRARKHHEPLARRPSPTKPPERFFTAHEGPDRSERTTRFHAKSQAMRVPQKTRHFPHPKPPPCVFLRPSSPKAARSS